MNEFDIQRHIYMHRASISAYPLLIPNVYHYRWESDLLYVTGSKYTQEYEIKISLADFKKDADKIEKHKVLSEKDYNKLSRPSAFWYVCPADLIDIKDIPDYAGLMYCNEKYTCWYNAIEVIKIAPRLSSEKITEDQISKLLLKANNRYWNKIVNNKVLK